jgi:diacylglycerol kinase family enzyme
MLGVGLNAEVVQRLPLALKRLLGRGAYAMQTLGEAARYHFAPLSVVIDGREVEARSVVVSKGRLYGGPYLLAPGADPGAPGFSVVLFGARGMIATLGYAAALPLNLLPHAPGLSWLQGCMVEIRADRAVPAQSDGDIAGTTPVLVQDAESAIEVVIGR